MADEDIEKPRRSEGQRMLDEENLSREKGERLLHQENMTRREAEQRSMGELVSELGGQVSTLLRDEMALIKAEGSQKLARARSGMTLIGVGAVLALAGVIVLLFAAVYGLAELMHMGWAALIVAAATLAMGGIAVRIGMKGLKPDRLTPERSVRSMRENADFAREKTHARK